MHLLLSIPRPHSHLPRPPASLPPIHPPKPKSDPIPAPKLPSPSPLAIPLGPGSGGCCTKGHEARVQRKRRLWDWQDTHSLGAGILDVFSRMRSIRRGFLRSSDLFWPLVLFLFSSKSERKKRHHASSLLTFQDSAPTSVHLHWSHHTCIPVETWKP